MLLPALGAASGWPAPSLLLFLIPAPLAVLLVLAGADAGVAGAAQLLGLLTASVVALGFSMLAAWAGAPPARPAAAAPESLRLLQTGLLLCLWLIGQPLLAGYLT
jgi:hypothetical protein